MQVDLDVPFITALMKSLVERQRHARARASTLKTFLNPHKHSVASSLFSLLSVCVCPGAGSALSLCTVSESVLECACAFSPFFYLSMSHKTTTTTHARRWVRRCGGGNGFSLCVCATHVPLSPCSCSPPPLLSPSSPPVSNLLALSFTFSLSPLLCACE